MDLLGNININQNTITGKSVIGSLSVNELETSTISNDEFNTLSGIITTTTIQNQLNNLMSLVETGASSTGGGYFVLPYETQTLATSTYWNNNKPLLVSCAGSINSIAISSQSPPSSSTTVKVRYSSDGITFNDTGLSITLSTSQSINSISGLTYLFTNPTWFIVSTSSGPTTSSNYARFSITCSSDGIVGPQGPQGPQGLTPELTIGTVSNVPYGTLPSVSISGSVLNFILETGPQGIQGPQGPKGSKGDPASSFDTGAFANTLLTTGVFLTLQGEVDGLITSVGGLTTSLATITGTTIPAIELEISGLQGQINTLDTDVGLLTTKTQNISATVGSTSFIGSVNVGSSINLNSVGAITGNTISVSNGYFDTIQTSVINNPTGIMTIGGVSSSTNVVGLFMINGVPLMPYNSASSFFSQW